MKKRSVAFVAAATVLFGLLSATPALATYTVPEIRFPNGAVVFYAPFAGPAEVEIDFNDFDDAGTNDPATTIEVRLRLKDAAGSIASQNYSVNPGAEQSPKTVSFSWPTLTPNAKTLYEVAVYRGGTQLRERTFTLHPYLTRITSISPDPFYPTIPDGFRDTTRISYHLAANATNIQILITNSDDQLVRQHTQFANRVAGNYNFTWSGRDDGGQVLPEGNYRVRVRATAPNGLTGTSNPVTVELDRFFTSTRTRTQNGDDFHHRGTTSVLRAGGTCSVARLTTPHDVRVNCTDARVRVFWRWTLNEPMAAIQSQTFTLVRVSGFTCGATFGRTGTTSGSDTFIRVGALGQRRCRVDKARVTYTFQDES
jgi:hypothetical protein